MHLFHELQEQAILQKNGVYSQAKLYSRGNELYVKYGSGFARVYKNGTSVPKLTVLALELDVKYDKLGRAEYNVV